MGEISTSNKRLAGEVFEVYRKRLRDLAKALKKRIGYGRVITIPVVKGHGRNHYLPADMKMESPFPKRHRGESFKDFKERRKVSNRNRRIKEKAA